jgi:hypothetical protein
LRAGAKCRSEVKAWSETRALIATIGAIGAVALGSIAWIYGAGLTFGGQGPIRGDGVGYYVYLPAVFLDHDLTMRRTADRSFDRNPVFIPGINYVEHTDGHTLPLNQFGIGEAMLIAPFFAAGHAVAVLTGADRRGFSWPYQAAANAAALTYVLLGLFLLASVLRRWFELRTVLLTTVAIAFGGAVFHYATWDATFSHGFSFFLVALVLRLALSVWERPRASTAAALGAALGLVGVVRLPNLVVLLVPALIGVERLADLRGRAVSLFRHVDLVAVGAGAFILMWLPQLTYWHTITGRLLVNSYEVTGAHLDLVQPNLVGVLFSVRKGLFFWTPLLLLAVAGLPFLRRAAPALFVPAVAYLAVMTWVAASWSIWWYGASFGMRAMIEALPVFALGLAALIEAARTTVARRAVAIAIAVTTLLAVHAMVAYWLQTIPYDGTTFRQYLDSFWNY